MSVQILLLIHQWGHGVCPPAHLCDRQEHIDALGLEKECQESDEGRSAVLKCDVKGGMLVNMARRRASRLPPDGNL